MKTNRPSFQPLQTALAQPDLNQLFEHAKQISVLDQLLRKSLTADLAALCVLANIRDNQLVFLVKSPAAATRLRLSTNQLLQSAKLATQLPLHGLSVKIDPTLAPPPQKPLLSPPLSKSAANHLLDAAASLKDPEVRDLLKHLADLA